MNRTEFATLGGVLPAVVQRKTNTRTLWGPNGEYDPDCAINYGWLVGRWAKISVNAEVFCRAAPGWVLVYVVDGRRAPLYTYCNTDTVKKSFRLQSYSRYEIDTAKMTATEKKTGRVLPLEVERG